MWACVGVRARLVNLLDSGGQTKLQGCSEVLASIESIGAQLQTVFRQNVQQRRLTTVGQHPRCHGRQKCPASTMRAEVLQDVIQAEPLGTLLQLQFRIIPILLTGPS